MRLVLILAALSFGVSACTDAPASSDATVAEAAPDPAVPDAGVASALIDGLDGSGVSGSVTFRETGDSLTVHFDLAGLPPGEHGFHVHEGDSCGPDSTGTPGGAAGGHFNPLASPHGAPSAAPADRHAGDLGNITADAEGRASGTTVDSLLTLSGPTSVVGHAVVIHGGRDDLTSQPSGDAGARIGCGVVREGELEGREGPGDRVVEPEA